MRNFRRLPPLMRVTGIVSLLLALATLVLSAEAFHTSLSSFPRWPANTVAILPNLGMLSGSCSIVVTAYSTRFHTRFDWLGRGPFPLDSWQSQLRALIVVAALPLCALALAIFIPATQPAFAVVVIITTLAAIVLPIALFWMPRWAARRGLSIR